MITLKLEDDDWALVWHAGEERFTIRIPENMPESQVPAAGELMTAFMLRVSAKGAQDQEFIDDLLEWLDQRAPPRQ